LTIPGQRDFQQHHPAAGASGPDIVLPGIQTVNGNATITFFS
jgi:hypothetical protein